MQTQNSAPPSTTGGTNLNPESASGRSGLSALAAAVEQLDSPGDQPTSDPTPSGAAPDPEPPGTPPGEEEAGETFTAENTGEQPSAEAAGDEPGDLSQSNSEEGLTGLDAETRAHALEIARAIKAGEIKAGELPRIAKLVAQKHEAAEATQQQIETLKGEIEKLKAGGGEVPESVPDMPATVAKLQTPQEIERRELRLQTVLDWCEDNPDGGEINGQSFGPEDVKAMRRDARGELRWLPKQAARLQEQAQFKASQQQVREQVLRDFPVLKDETHPDTVVARQLLRDPRFQREPNADYLALAMARGHRVLQEERAARLRPAKPKASGPVPAGKPASGGGGGGAVTARPKTAGSAVAAAKERIGTERSLNSLANLIAAGES